MAGPLRGAGSGGWRGRAFAAEEDGPRGGAAKSRRDAKPLDAPHPRTGARVDGRDRSGGGRRSEEHTSELPSLMRTSYAVSCLTTKHNHTKRMHESGITRQQNIIQDHTQ